jgi:cysteinyl-tRNA synthetase
MINSAHDKKTELTQKDIDLLKKIYQNFVIDVLGLKAEDNNSKTSLVLGNVVNLVLDIRNKAKAEKNFQLSDEIRNKLTEAGVQVKDSKEGSTWKI